MKLAALILGVFLLCVVLGAAAGQEAEESVFPVVVKMFCDCGGEMKPTGECLTVYPPIYPHKCEKCGRVEHFRKVYPFVAYKPTAAGFFGTPNLGNAACDSAN